MSSGPHAFKQCDLERAMRAAEKVRPGGYRVRISREGVIEVLPANLNERIESSGAALEDELETWLARQ